MRRLKRKQDTRQQDKRVRWKHLGKPAIQKLPNLCTDPQLKHGVDEVRGEWGIDKPYGSFDEGNKLFWQPLTESDRNDPEYYDKWYEGKTMYSST